MSRFVNLLTNVGTAGQTGTPAGIERRLNADRHTLQVIADQTSFQITVQATNVFNFDTNVGSRWVNMQSGTITGSVGLFVFDQGVSFAGYRVNVNSCSSGTLITAVFGA